MIEFEKSQVEEKFLKEVNNAKTIKMITDQSAKIAQKLIIKGFDKLYEIFGKEELESNMLRSDLLLRYMDIIYMDEKLDDDQKEILCVEVCLNNNNVHLAREHLTKIQNPKDRIALGYLLEGISNKEINIENSIDNLVKYFNEVPASNHFYANLILAKNYFIIKKNNIEMIKFHLDRAFRIAPYHIEVLDLYVKVFPKNTFIANTRISLSEVSYENNSL